METKTSYYTLNGKLAREELYKNGKRDGISKHWYQNGQLHIESFYKDGSLDGVYKRWLPSGQLNIERHYSNGKLNGLCKTWYPIDQLYHETYYIDNCLMPRFHEAIEKIIKFRKRIKCWANALDLTPRKFYNLSKLVKTQTFIEWYYHPQNYGGLRHKRIMQQWFDNKFV